MAARNGHGGRASLDVVDSVKAAIFAARSAASSTDFHLLLACAAHNGALLSVLSAVREVLRHAFETMHARLLDMADIALRRHRELYAALSRRDAEAARHLMRRHLEDFEARRRLCELE